MDIGRQVSRAGWRIVAVVVLLLLGSPGSHAQDAAKPAAPPKASPWSEKEASGERGLRLRTDGACEGFTLLAPLNSRQVHLVDLDGTVVHSWETGTVPGGSCELLPNGHLLRCGQEPDNPRFHGGGIGGRIEELDWDGHVVWQHVLAGADLTQHHEVQPLPNGNLLAIAWEYHPRDEVVAHGRDPAVVGDEGLWPDVILELRPVQPEGAEVVWTWRTWDHLVQDRDPALPDYGVPAEHPGRIDLNADHRFDPPQQQESEEARQQREEQERQMRALGYVGGTDPAPPDAAQGPKKVADWLHTNSVDYEPDLDLIAVSSPHLSEIWIIDHSTTTAEAATGRGGRFGHGGDLLWRWGNPRNWGKGGEQDRRLFSQHDATWLPRGSGAAPHLLLFNNGGERPDGDHSEVLELVLPFDGHAFVREGDAAWGPMAPVWSYSDPGKFFSGFISGAQRLPNGNTLICSGAPGHVFEVATDGRVTWDYLNPLGGEVEPSEQGGKAPPKALFRVQRVPQDSPGLAGRLGG